ncbi:dihydrodipicolinate synthase family protein [Pollutimonas sp. M17]|uniref:dihydrodipicolinate synthase family protein n=1 Tax=Pollutimonas sp. M17 TaxID=2962065 RepID=UPI0021F4D150|nr:dihydrodipicolinate synthase family protein [Pollutimonas sp. M17]UYO93764.1 dihydrodipicolinate synthase family protein [Pollutimonas sp. M17]HWK71899.1 dihydrodipicolinate synthase family protein [Burkholderiaceae bacterium]
MAGKKPSGVLTPVLTPFNSDYSVSRPRFLKHCRALIEQDVGLAVFGTNSEANSLSVAEKRHLLDVLADEGLPTDRMMPGTGCCAITDSVELTRHAVDLGCAGVLMLPPFYYKGVSDEGLYRNYASIIDAIGDDRLKIYLYHIPPVSQVGISLNLIERLLKDYPGAIAGIKDSSGDWNNTAAMLKEFQPAGFDVFAGSEVFLLRTLRHGGAGCITATGNVNAAAIARLAATWRDDDAGADEQQSALDGVRGIFQKYPMIPAMKSAIAWQAQDPAWAVLRPPLVELTADQTQALRQDLSAASFQIQNAQALAHADA